VPQAPAEVWCSDDGGEHGVEVVRGPAPVSKSRHYAAFVTSSSPPGRLPASPAWALRATYWITASWLPWEWAC